MRVSPPPILEDSTRVALGAFGSGVFLTMGLSTTLGRLDPRVGVVGALLGFLLVMTAVSDDLA